MVRVFIDGSHGTTGLRIAQRLAQRTDLEILEVPEALRKDPETRKALLAKSDIAFLCLPDSAARESVALAQGSGVRILDTSTAHRTDPTWTYGFPELSQKAAMDLRTATRVAVPGCHASGFIALISPLVQAGLLPTDVALTCFSLTGYSGGGKPMIAEYQAEDRSVEFDAPRQYGLTQQHKHLPEMKAVCGLTTDPVFCPIVADYYSGMEVTVPLHASQLTAAKTPEELLAFYTEFYAGDGLVGTVKPEGAMLAANTLSGLDRMEITVTGNADRMLLIARFDNLGKGASGAAIECMNIMLGLPASYGLTV